MQMKDWERTKQILLEILNLAPEKREDFLADSEVSAEIRREVESLLANESAAEEFMSLTAGGFSREFFGGGEAAETSIIGLKIGIYEITEEIGGGGMGAVYQAKRVDGKFEQKVAIKMLKREYNTGRIRRRFEIEKEIQSKLHHPNIAALLDSGRCGDGVPYLVMEYIEGVPVDVFCRERSLDLKARLKLFNKVCEAVGFAHRNLIIHRDLKPSNILVNESGEPKLLDFGISKLLDAENSADKNTVTMLGAMTPEYASPEQIAGEQVATATDIYSLGVILFNLLTETHPFETDRRKVGEISNTTGRAAPRTPSSAFREKGKGRRGKRGKGRKGDGEIFEDDLLFSPASRLPFPLSRLKGDLDNIILKALRLEPERRYKTAEQFSADLWRFVDDLPVLARPATASYRANKFFQRHKISVFAGIFIFLSIFAGLTTAVWQAFAAREQAQIAAEMQKQAEAGTAHARAEEEKAKKISEFMSKVISYANPSWYAEGSKFKGEVKLIDVMDDLSAKIDVEFAGQPDVQSELHHKFAEVYHFSQRGSRVESARAKELYHARRALDLRRQFYGEKHELVAKDLFYLWCSAAVETGEANDENYAKTLAKAMQMMRETNPHNLNLPYMIEAYTAQMAMPGSRETHEKYRQAVTPPTTENKYQIAERYLLEALPIFRKHYKEDNSAIYANECKLAYVQIMQNKSAEAAPHYQICQEAMTKLQDESQLKSIGKYLSQVKEAAAANNR